MSATDVSICSNALLMLGAKAINAFDPDGTDEGQRAALAGNLYPQLRDALLRSHYWNCATKRVILAPLAQAPDFDYSAQFQLPADWQRTLQVGDRRLPIEYVQEGRRILANTDALPLVYIFRNEDVGSWDPQLVHVLTLQMAAAMAYPITQSASLAEAKAREAELALKRAKAYDGQDNPPEEISDAPMYQSRFGSLPSRRY